MWVVISLSLLNVYLVVDHFKFPKLINSIDYDCPMYENEAVGWPHSDEV